MRGPNWRRDRQGALFLASTDALQKPLRPVGIAPSDGLASNGTTEREVAQAAD